MSRSERMAGVKKVRSSCDAGGGEAVAGVGGGDGAGGLLHGGELAGGAAHEAHGFAVDAEEAGDGLGLAGPVDGVGGGEVVGVGPDGEVGVVGDEGCGGRAEGRELLGEEGGGGEEGGAGEEEGCEGVELHADGAALCCRGVSGNDSAMREGVGRNTFGVGNAFMKIHP